MAIVRRQVEPSARLIGMPPTEHGHDDRMHDDESDTGADEPRQQVPRRADQRIAAAIDRLRVTEQLQTVHAASNSAQLRRSRPLRPMKKPAGCPAGQSSLRLPDHARASRTARVTRFAISGILNWLKFK